MVGLWAGCLDRIPAGTNCWCADRPGWCRHRPRRGWPRGRRHRYDAGGLRRVLLDGALVGVLGAVVLVFKQRLIHHNRRPMM